MELTLYGKSDFPYLQDLLLKEKNSLPLWAKSFL